MTAAALLVAVGLCACPQSPSSPSASSGSPAAPGAAPGSAGHGVEKALGRLTVGEHSFDLKLLGEVTPGKESGLEAKPSGGKTVADYASIGVYAWVEDADGKQLSAPDKAKVEAGALHFHLSPRADAGAPKRVVLRVRAGDKDERGSVPLDGHGHEHAATPHDGVIAAFNNARGERAGYLELKLHDDKGDLELWLARDERMKEPFDLPLDARPRVRLLDVQSREVELAVRNRDNNEDEDGTPNARDGKTSYFIFPGATGAGSSWLKGEAFSSLAVVTFSRDGETFTSEELMLVPHTHGGGHGH